MRRLGLLCIVVGCVTPSVPVPPPATSTYTFHVATGQATFQASADSNWPKARVDVFDEMTGMGVITTSNVDGSVPLTEPFAANAGDRIDIVYSDGAQVAGTCLILRDGQADDTDRCP